MTNNVIILIVILILITVYHYSKSKKTGVIKSKLKITKKHKTPILDDQGNVKAVVIPVSSVAILDGDYYDVDGDINFTLTSISPTEVKITSDLDHAPAIIFNRQKLESGDPYIISLREIEAANPNMYDGNPGIGTMLEMENLYFAFRYDAKTCSFDNGMTDDKMKLNEIIYDMKSSKKECNV